MRGIRERHFRAMGGDAHVVVVGARPDLLDLAAGHLERLEERWSRFRHDSEVSVLGQRAGRAVAVSADTALLVGLAIEGWRRTAGRFDPTLLAAVRAAGYTTTFDELSLDAPPRLPTPEPAPDACGRIRLDAAAGTVILPPGTGFDAGGVGKGLAADLMLAALLEAGADGACVGVAGDVRVGGAPPDGHAWRVALPAAVGGGQVAVGGGALATSSRLVRTWPTAGGTAHHLIDAATAHPARVPTTTATVVAGSAWEADVLATAALLAGPAEGLKLLARHHAEGRWADADGHIVVTEGLRCRRSS